MTQVLVAPDSSPAMSQEKNTVKLSPRPKNTNNPIEPTAPSTQAMPPPPVPQRAMPKGKGTSKSPTLPKASSSIIQKPDPEVIAIHDADSEDSWGLWGTADEESMTTILALLKEKPSTGI
eukprot:4675772-Amphidinium_carterae.1